MAEAFICDYVRTPIGRYAGALASVRADDLAALPIRELMRRHPGLAEKIDEVVLGCSQPGRRGQPQPRAHGAVARRASRRRSGHDGQSPLRLGNGRGRRGGARDQGGRDRACGCGRRRIDVPRPVRDGEGRDRVPALGRDLRHDHRLALRQSHDEEAPRRRFDAGDGSERRRRIPGLARGPGRVRAALATARRSALRRMGHSTPRFSPWTSRTARAA